MTQLEEREVAKTKPILLTSEMPVNWKALLDLLVNYTLCETKGPLNKSNLSVVSQIQERGEGEKGRERNSVCCLFSLFACFLTQVLELVLF